MRYSRVQAVAAALGTTALLTILLAIEPAAGVAAAVLPPLIPRALARSSRRALARANRELAVEVAERRAAETKLRALLESTPDAMLVVDKEGRVELANGRATRLLGYEGCELVGQPLSRLVPDASGLRQLRRAAGPLELDVRRRDGVDVPAELGVSRVDGDPQTLVVVLRDAADRRRQHAAHADRLRAEAARIQAEATGRRAAFLAEASRVLGGSLDDEATLKSMARVAVPYLADYVVVEVVDAERRLRRLAAVHARPEAEATLAAAPAPFAAAADSAIEGVLARGESTLVREVDDAWLAARPADAARVGARALQPRSLLMVPLSARGRVLGVVVFALTHPSRRYTLADLALAEDLAQRAALAADNARLFREAHDASRAKDEFLAVLSHELRTPLTPVLGWLRVLRAGSLAPAAAARALETVERNARLQLQLVDDLLDVSRIVAGTLRLDVRPVALAAVLETAVDSVAAIAAQKGIAVSRSVGPDVPPVTADETRLQQVLANLLSNAVKFTPDGGRVSVTVTTAGPSVRIAVADTGEGLLPEVAPHVFERFRQADSTLTRHYGGLGLGLAIVRHLVELHGGAVSATSDGPGCGTTVTVTLPVAGPDA
jgi:PAS domain S-box-containing protein